MWPAAPIHGTVATPRYEICAHQSQHVRRLVTYAVLRCEGAQRQLLTIFRQLNFIFLHEILTGHLDDARDLHCG